MVRASQLAALAAGALVAVVACGPSSAVEGPTSDPPSDPAAAAEPVPEVPVEPDGSARPPGVDHVVGEGETLWDIAHAYGVSVPTLMEANALDARDVRRLRRGAVLRVPGVSPPAAATGGATEDGAEGADATDAEAEGAAPGEDAPRPEVEGALHRLAEGETLWDVARTYDVSVDALLEANAFDDDEARSLRSGRAILVPGATDEAVAQAVRARIGDAAARRRGTPHEVAEGETLWDVARAHHVSVAELMAVNGLDAAAAAAIAPGTTLLVPSEDPRPRGDRSTTPHARRMTPRQTRALAEARRLGLGTRTAASSLLHGRLRPEWLRAASRGTAPGRTPGTLRWPVSNGWFVRGYGSGEGGYHQAVDIMGEIGWNVRASAPGVVGYSGDEVPGYGNVVFVVHAGGWVTMYAHNSVNFAVAGERVAAGAVLAELGSTGISRGPHVHFEFIHDGRECDPGPLFRPGIRHHDGHLSSVRPLRWPRADAPPEGLRCARRRHHPRSRWVAHETVGPGEGDE